MKGREPLTIRAYRALLRLLPPHVRARDGEEMVATFAAMWREGRSVAERIGCLARSFGRLPAVAAAEWRDHLGAARPVRRARGGGARMDAMRRAVAVGVRGLLRAPAFTWTAVLLLGLGVGAVTTIFTVVDHLFLRPLPYPHAERLIRIQNGSHSFPDLRDLQTMPSVEAWAASQQEDVNLTGEADPLRLRQARVTEGFFGFFGARPQLGRLLLPEDFGAADVVVLSHAAWERFWGRDPDVVGRTLRIDGDPVLVAGVLARSFSPPEVMVDGAAVDVWRPVDRSHPLIDDRGWHTLAVAGRLARGATLEDAARDAAAVAERRAEEVPERYVGRDGSIRELPVVTLQEATVGRAREGFGLLLGAVTLLLLVACANVAHLFMARGVGRSREMAVRRALGAGTPALAGQLLAESLLIAAGGTLVGILLAALALPAFLALGPEGIPRTADVTLDARVLAFAAALSASTALAFGLLPTLRVAGRDPGDALRSGGRGAAGGRGARALRTGLIAAEVAISLVLVSCAGLLVQSFARLHDQSLGFRVDDVWTIPLGFNDPQERDERLQRLDGLAQALRELPGVRSVTYGLSVPLEHTGGNRCCWRTGVRPPEHEAQGETTVHPFAGDFIDVLEPRLVAGQPWRPEELGATPASALLNEALAVEMFGSVEAAVGREVLVGGGGVSHRVVGVLADDRHYGPDQEHGSAMYIPMQSVPWAPEDVHFAIRMDGIAADVPRRLREAVWSVEPEIPVPLVRSMEEWASAATARTRFESLLFSAFGVVALLLAAGGLYGTLLFAVGTERRELGIRLALGARRGSVEARVLGRALRTTALGLTVGGLGVWASGRLLESRLFGIQAADPATFLGAVGLLLITAAIASWLPARRAGAVDPREMLRQD